MPTYSGFSSTKLFLDKPSCKLAKSLLEIVDQVMRDLDASFGLLACGRLAEN
jgi:hypothetical protein